MAERVLPEIDALDEEFRALQAGKTGRLHIAIECHACFDWLFPVLELFRHAWPDVDVDIRAGLAFDALPALMREEVDLVISSDPEDLPGVTFNAACSITRRSSSPRRRNPLAQKAFVEAEDFRDQTADHLSGGPRRLDIFTELLTPAKVEPRGERQVELTAVILMLVRPNRGVAVLPDWVVREVKRPCRLRHPAGDRGGADQAALCGDARRRMRRSPTWRISCGLGADRAGETAKSVAKSGKKHLSGSCPFCARSCAG